MIPFPLGAMAVEKMPMMLELPLDVAEDMEIGDKKEVTLKLKLSRRMESEEYSCATFELLKVLDEGGEEEE